MYSSTFKSELLRYHVQILTGTEEDTLSTNATEPTTPTGLHSSLTSNLGSKWSVISSTIDAISTDRLNRGNEPFGFYIRWSLRTPTTRAAITWISSTRTMLIITWLIACIRTGRNIRGCLTRITNDETIWFRKTTLLLFETKNIIIS